MDATTPEITEKVREMMMAKLPSERMMIGCLMRENFRYLVTRAILEENPAISKTELRKELFLKFYDCDFTSEEKERILKHLEETA